MSRRGDLDPGWDPDAAAAETGFAVLALIVIALAVIFVILLAFFYPPFQAFSQSLGSGLGAMGVWIVDFVFIGGPILVFGVAAYILLRASSRSGSEALSELPEADYFDDGTRP